MQRRTVFTLGLLLMGIAITGAQELAVTQSGKKVILKNDGTWELYDATRHIDGRDIRESGPVVELFIKYKDHKFASDQRKSELQADDIVGRALEDSLKRVPKGGIVYIQINTDRLNREDPRHYSYAVRDMASKKIILQRDGSERDAVDSDDVGISNLAVLPIPSAPRGDMQIEIQNRVSKEAFEFVIPKGGF